MNNHFVHGFTIKDTFHQSSSQQDQEPQNHDQAINLGNSSFDESGSEDEMLFKIGNKHIGQQKNIVIDLNEQSYESDDSDKTINLKEQKKKKVKKDKKLKKHKKHKHQHKEKHKKHKNQKYSDQYQSFQQIAIQTEVKIPIKQSSEQEGEVSDKQQKERKQKEKKIKKHKDKHHKKSRQKNESPQTVEVVWTKIFNENKINTAQQTSQNVPLFPSLINKQTPPAAPQQSLVPLPSHLKPYTNTGHSAQLYNSYLQKLTQSNLLPSRTIRQLSSSIVQKSEEFAFLYENDTQRFEQQSDRKFITNAKLPDYLRCDLKFDIVRFPINQIYTYGKHMDKEIPKYQLIENFHKVIGIKDKKQPKYKKMLKHIYQQLNQKDYAYHLKPNKDKGNLDRYFHYEGYQNIQGAVNLVQKRDKLKFLKIKHPNKIMNSKMSKDNMENSQFIAFEPQNKLPCIDYELQMLESSNQQKFKQINRQMTQTLIQNPKDTQLWLKLVELQDQLYAFNSYGFNANNGFSQMANKQLKLGGFITEKKLSILAKALNHNPYDQVLGLMFIRQIFSLLRQYQAKLQILGPQLDSAQKIQAQLDNYIKRYPTNQSFWLMYLQLKLQLEPFINLTLNFNHTYIKHIFKQISVKINYFISTQKSSQTIIKLRSISLLILSKIIAFYRKEGYIELSLAIGVALVQFNLFVPQRVYKMFSRQNQLERKKKEFMKYWEDYNGEKIGDLKWDENRSWEIWDYDQEQKSLIAKKDLLSLSLKETENMAQERKVQKKKKIKSVTYIDHEIKKKSLQFQQIEGSGIKQTIQEYSSEIVSQIEESQRLWHFACPLYNKPRIKLSIDSLVLYQDIDQWLMNYRDTESIIKVINMLTDLGIGIIPVFSQDTTQSNQGREADSIFGLFAGLKFTQKTQHLFEDRSKSSKLCIQVKENQKLLYKRCQSRMIFSSQLNDELFEQEYWPPEMTICFFGIGFIKKMIYLSRLLRVVSQKVFPVLIQQKSIKQAYELNKYRLFLLGCMFLINSQIKRDQQMSNQQKELIERIVEKDQDIIEEIKEIIGWWEVNKPTNTSDKQDQATMGGSIVSGKGGCYDQAKIWAMYIELEWMKHYYQNQVNASIRDSQLQQKVTGCLGCYKVLLRQTVHNKQAYFTRTLFTLRYCYLFVVSLTIQQRQLSQQVKLNFAMLISLLVRPSTNSQPNQTEVIDQINVITDRLTRLAIDNLSLKHSQNSTLSRIKINKISVSPIYRLELISTIESIYDQIKQKLPNQFTKSQTKYDESDQYSQSNLSCQSQLIPLMQWLKQLVSAYNNLMNGDRQKNDYNECEDSDNDESEQRKQIKLSQLTTQNRGKQIMHLYSSRIQRIVQKSYSITVVNHNAYDPNSSIEGFLLSKTDNSIVAYRIFKYLNVNSVLSSQYTNQLKSVYQQLLVLRLRQAQQILLRINNSLRIDVRRVMIQTSSVNDIFICKMRKIYNHNVNMLKLINFGPITDKYHQSVSKVNLYQKQCSSKQVYPQEQLGNIIQLTISLLKQIYMSQGGDFQQKITQMKQILYQLLVKYPYSKSFYINYLKLISIQVAVVKNELKRENHEQRTKRMNGLIGQMGQVYERMSSYGVRVVNKNNIFTVKQ